MKSVILLIFLSAWFIGCSQDNGTMVKAEPEYFDDGVSGTSLHILHQLKNNTIPSHEKSYAVRVPASFSDGPIAWGSVYFAGNKKTKTNSTVFFLIAGYEGDGSRIVFDRNGNTDFTDDSVFAIKPKEPFVIRFVNEKDDKAVLPVKLVFRNDITDSSLMRFHAMVTRNNPLALPSRFMVLEKGMNYRKVLLADSNRITLYDYNRNGFYDDKEDKVVAGDIQQKGLRLHNNPVRTKPAGRGAELPYSNNTYRITDIDPYGNAVSVVVLNTIMDTAERLASFSYRDEKDRKKDFSINGSKPYSVLYIWGAWCIGCVQHAPEFVKLMKEQEANVDYYTFNTGDKEEIMMKYLSVKKMPFKPWRISNSAVTDLNVEGFPSYLVVDNNNRIVLRSGSVGELERFFKNQNQ
jgi:thiol-disulfide isomerase/thioredoxin